MHIRKRSFFLLIVMFLCIQQLSIAQNTTTEVIDSVYTVAAGLATDTARVNFYHNQIGKELTAKSKGVKIDMGRLEGYALTAIELAQETDFTSGKARIYYDLGTIHWHMEEYGRAAEYYSMAMKENDTLGDISGQANAIYMMGLCEYRRGMYGEALDYYLTAVTYAKEADAISLVFRCYNSITNAWFYVGDYESERQSALEALALAREKNDISYEAEFSLTIADASKRLGDAALAVEYYDKAQNLYRQSGAAETRIVRLLINKSSVYAPDSQEKLATLMEAVDILKGIAPMTQEGLTFLSHAYVNIGIWYALTGDHQTAREYYDQAMEVVRESGDKYRMIFVYTHIAQYYYDQGNYTKAKPLAEQTIELINTHIGKNHNFDIALKVLSGIYAKEGSYRKAYETLLQWSVINDTIQVRSQREEVEKINRRYTYEHYRQEKLNIQEMDIQQQKLAIQKQHTLIVGLSVISLLFFAMGMLIYFYSRRLKAKNRSLLNRISERDKLEKENETLRDQMSDGSELYFKLKELMSDPEVFTNPEIGRKMIAERLGTNEKYIYDTIHKYYNMSVSDYITNLRLNHARKLLSLPAEKYTIEAVALDAGFTNRHTFHRLFKDRYDMTPHEFRRLMRVSN